MADHTFLERDFALGDILRHSCVRRGGNQRDGHDQRLCHHASLPLWCRLTSNSLITGFYKPLKTTLMKLPGCCKRHHSATPALMRYFNLPVARGDYPNLSYLGRLPRTRHILRAVAQSQERPEQPSAVAVRPEFARLADSCGPFWRGKFLGIGDVLACDIRRPNQWSGSRHLRGGRWDKILDAEYKVVEHQIAPPLGPLAALAISTTFLSKMARTNEEQQPKANSNHW